MNKRIPQSFIDDVVSRSDIVDIVSSRMTALRKKGQNFSACCPFHQEKTPSFTVSQSKQFYHCFGCGASGNVIGFVMEYDRLSFLEALTLLAEGVGLTLPEGVGDAGEQASQRPLLDCLQRVLQAYQRQLREHPQAKRAIAYLKSRGLTGKLCQQFGIGFAPPGWDYLLKFIGDVPSLHQAGLLSQKEERYYDRFRDRIMFPIRDERGRVIGFGGRVLDDSSPKYLNSPETAVFHKGRELYGLYEARKSHNQLPRLMVVEGYMDVMALHQYGITYAVATLGTATTADHIKKMFRVSDEIVFCFDGDAAGCRAAWRALEMSLPLMQGGRQAKFLFLPTGHDPDSLVREEGREAFEKRIAGAQSLSACLFNKLLGEVDVNTLEGQVKLVHLCKPLFEQVKDDVLQAALSRKLSQLTQLSEARLQDTLDRIPAPPRRPSTLEPIKAKSQTLTPIRRAIMLLLQYPEKLVILCQSCFEHLQLDESLPGAGLLQELGEVVCKTPKITTGLLLEHFREHPHQAYLHQLAVREHAVPDVGVVTEFSDTLDKLSSHIQQVRIEALMQQASQGGLRDDERAQLQALLVAQK